MRIGKLSLKNNNIEFKSEVGLTFKLNHVSFFLSSRADWGWLQFVVNPNLRITGKGEFLRIYCHNKRVALCPQADIDKRLEIIQKLLAVNIIHEGSLKVEWVHGKILGVLHNQDVDRSVFEAKIRLHYNGVCLDEPLTLSGAVPIEKQKIHGLAFIKFYRNCT